MQRQWASPAAALALASAAFVSVASAAAATTLGALGTPTSLPAASAAGGYFTAPYATRERPHPAVVRIVVPEGEMTSYGSGTLIDVRDQYGLVVTNWHVVRDSRGEVEVIFPDGFTSQARPLKVDADWDLAALIIWRPPVEPVKIAAAAPRPGDPLTICGYGSGQYRSATGRCTQYYSPTLELPQQMVELDVEARQGDSGGPIFNDRGELAGVLFGAGQGTTMGSFGGRVESFLASLAPDIGQGADAATAHAHAPRMHAVEPPVAATAVQPQPSAKIEAAAPADPAALATSAHLANSGPPDPDNTRRLAESRPAAKQVGANAATHPWASPTNRSAASPPAPQVAARAATATIAGDWFATAKNVLAAIGAVAIVLQLVRIVR